MNKNDLFFSAVTGLLAAVFLLAIKYSGNIITIHDISYLEATLLLFPALAVLGIRIAAIFGQRFSVLFQAAKFLLVGGLNTFVDLGILNILIAASGITAGIGFSIFKGFSFLIAVGNSYLWNKYWTFGEKKSKQDFIAQGKEFAQFLLISGIGFFLNVGTASAVVNFISPQFGLSARAWPTVGALAGTLVVMTWNFLGYKFVVFKR
ncbi:MAG: GtrA family protein [Candidatus Colwellbacteria bacterium]|nr:GtrA family protein [Candidatus Colwellbacteria bacterium]